MSWHAPSDRAAPLAGGGLYLTDAGMETVLIFQQRIELPCFAAFPLVDNEAGRAALRAYYEPFLALARSRGTGFVLGAPTWRANPDWGTALGYDADALAAVNRRSVELVDELRTATPDWGQPILLEGLVGPRADGYSAASAMSSTEAERYHATQLRALADTAADLATALTIPTVDEAIGIVRAATAVGLPVALSFTVEVDGRLPSGQGLGEAIEQVDDATDGAAAYFMVNCAHPTHIEPALDDDGPWLGRIRGLRANASTRSHEELDAAEELDDGDPADLGARCAALGERLPNIALLGGCCGSDVRHVAAIHDAWVTRS